MLPGHVINKLKAGQNRVEFLSAGNLYLSFLRQQQAVRKDIEGINGPLTMAADG
jgi:hypothetical protein